MTSFKIYWFNLLAAQGTLKSLLQHHSPKALVQRRSGFFMVQLSQLSVTTAATAKLLHSNPTLCDPTDGSPPGSPIPGILQARTLEFQPTGVGYHFLLQSMKVKSESEVAQSCPTLHDPMDCSPPGSSIHEIFPGKSTGVGCHCLLRSMTTRKTMTLTMGNFVSKVMSLLFKTLSRFLIAFLPRNNCLLISWLQLPSRVIFKAQEKEICHCFHFFPFYLP